MRGRGLLAAGLVIAALVLAACGGSPPPEDPWRPSGRVLNVSDRWWWEPVEIYCEEDDDCQPGESCQNMRLATCANCPRGESTGVCVGPDGQQRRTAQRPD